MPDVKRKKNETFDSLLRRFNKKIQQSGCILQAKKVRYFISEKSKNLKKKSTLRSLMIKDKIDYLKKIGKWQDDSTGIEKVRKNIKR